MRFKARLMIIMLFATNIRAAEGIPFIVHQKTQCQDVFETCDAARGALKAHIDALDTVTVDLQNQLAAETKRANDEASKVGAWYRNPLVLILSGVLVGIAVKR